MHRTRLFVAVLAIALIAGCQNGPTDKKAKSTPLPIPETRGSVPDVPENLSTMTPYIVPAASEPDEPAGFEPVFTQSVARHGSRTLTRDDAIKDAIELYEEAKSADALTQTGRRFGPAARALYEAMDDVGFGDLNTLGKEEMLGLGVREGERLNDMFEQAVQGGVRIDVIDSGRDRAIDSAKNFSQGLQSVHPGLDIEPTEDDEKMLKFDATNDDYEDFLDGDDWKGDYYRVRQQSDIDEVALGMLTRLYKPSFVADIDSTLAAASAVFEVFKSGPAMRRDVKVDTRPFVEPKAAQVFAYVEDGRYFYRRGPGVEGDDRTYKAASVLLKDFFDVIDDHLEERGPHPHAAVFRFAHGEEMIPFAALLELPGNEQGQPGETFTYENNEFRVEDSGRLSTNIGWTVWAKDDTTLVSVSKDEEPTTIGRGCQPYEDTTSFYEYTELKRCLGDLT